MKNTKRKNKIKKAIQNFIAGCIMWLAIDGIIFYVLCNLDKFTTIYK